jgi:hypothetical protein
MLAKPPSLSAAITQQGNSISVKQAAAPRITIIGRYVVGGVITYMATTGTNNEFLHIVVTFSGHQVDAIEAIYFDQYTLVLSSGNETSKYAGGFLFVETKLGAAGEAAFPGLVSDTAGLGASAWTSSCRQDGCCSIHFKLKWDQTKYANGVPNIRAKIRGALLFDPRTSTTAWSNNWALAVRYWLVDRVNGLKCATSEINDTLFIAAANLSDEAVALAAGGTEPRYTCNGIYDTSKTRGTVLSGLLTAGAGRLPPVSGQWGLYGGAWRAPALTLGDDDFRAGLQMTGKVSRRDLASGVKGDFVDPNNDWQSNSFPPMVLASYVADDSGTPGTAERGRWLTATAYSALDAVMSNGFAYVCTSGHTSGASTQPGVGASWPTVWALAAELNWKTVSYPFTTSAATAQRLAKIDLETVRRQISLAAPCKLGGYLAQPPEVLQITASAFGFVNKTFEIVQCDLAPQSDLALGVDFSLQETDANVYAWSTAFEQTQQPLAGISIADITNPVAPGAPSLTSGAGTVLLRGDGIKLSRIQVTWTAPADQFVLSGGKIFGEYQVHASGNWQPAFEVDGATTIAFIQGVSDSVVYDVRIRSRNVHDVYSAWAETDNHTVSSTTSYFTGGTIGNSTGKNLLGNPGFENNISGTPTSTALAANADATDEWFVFGISAFHSVSIDTSAPRGGAKSLLIRLNQGVTVPNDSVLYQTRVWTKARIAARIGDIVRVSGYSRWDQDTAIPAGVTVTQRIGVAFFDASDAFLGELNADVTNAAAGTGAYSLQQASLQVPATLGGGVPAYARVQCCGFVRNTGGSSFATSTHTYADLRFDDLMVVLQSTPFDLTPVSTTGTIIGGANPLSQSGTSLTINVAATTWQFGDGQISYNSGTCVGSGYSLQFVEADDPTYSGGAVTYTATTTGSNTVGAPGRLYFGEITLNNVTPATGDGGGTAGGGPKGKGQLTP